jgi:metal-responsive CopG/Arc/MetJ family transcriptional regulator
MLKISYIYSITWSITMGNVKTAISLDEDLFMKVEKLADKLNLSRSRFFSQAAEYMIEKNENIELLQKINKAYEDIDGTAEKDYINKTKLKYSKIIKGTW